MTCMPRQMPEASKLQLETVAILADGEQAVQAGNGRASRGGQHVATVQGLHRFHGRGAVHGLFEGAVGHIMAAEGNFCSCGAAVGGGAAAHGRKVIQAQRIAILGRVGHVVARMHVAASGDEQAVHQLDDVAGVLSVCLGAPGDGGEENGHGPGSCHAVDVFHIHALKAIGLVQRRRNSNDHGIVPFVAIAASWQRMRCFCGCATVSPKPPTALEHTTPHAVRQLSISPMHISRNKRLGKSGDTLFGGFFDC